MNRKRTRLPFPKTWGAVLLLLTVLAAAFAFSAPAHAQEPRERPFDLSIVAGPDDSKQNVRLTVTNHGDEDAFGVQVKLELTEGEGTVFRDFGGIVDNSRSDVEISSATSTTAIWNIGRLPAGDDIELDFGFRPPGSGLPQQVLSVTATLSSEAPVEEDIYLDNNSITAWRTEGADRFERSFIAFSGVQLEAEIDDRFPSTGEEVTFTVFAENTSSGSLIDELGLIFDLEVDVELDGLTLVSATTTPNPLYTNTTSFNGAVGDSRGTWDIGDDIIYPGNFSELHIVAALDGDRPLEDRCLTAAVAESRPHLATHEDGYVDGRDGDYDEEGTVTVCLGEDPTPVVIDSGHVDLMLVYPCIGVATYPCDDTDTLELVTVAPSRPGGIQRTDIRTSGDGYGSFGQTILRPEDVIIQVKFPFGFHPDDDSWRTAQTNGVNHTWSTTLLSTVADWSDIQLTNSVPSGVTLPGGLSIRMVASPTTVIADPVNTPSFPPTALSYTRTYSLPLFVAMEELGTYKLEFSVVMTHATIDADGDGNKDKFTASGTYTFHAGPIAELAVEDGPASPQIAADQRAFTIVATNNGPDTAHAAQVTVAGLSDADYVSHTATRAVSTPVPGFGTSGSWI